jgi:WD40 repeat protein
MFPKIVCLAIAIICSSLLSACKELAIPSFAEIPIPKTIAKSKSTITLTVTDITDTVPFTERQIAVVWATNAGRYIGTLDMDAQLIRQLKVSLPEDYFSEGLLWSPDGSTLIYQQTSLDHGFDVIAIHADASGYIHTIDNFHYPPSCTWSPDGQYLTCSSIMCHGCPRDLYVYDSTSWEAIHYGYESGMSGRDPSLLQETKKVAQEFCSRYKDNAQDCAGDVDSSEHFVLVWAKDKLLIVDVDKRQVVRIGTRPDDLSWSADKSQLAWIENGEIRVFDAATHAVTTFTLPDAKFLNVAWHP